MSSVQEIMTAAIDYEAAWSRYASIEPGTDNPRVRIAKAEAHQRLLNAVRIFLARLAAEAEGGYSLGDLSPKNVTIQPAIESNEARGV